MRKLTYKPGVKQLTLDNALAGELVLIKSDFDGVKGFYGKVGMIESVGSREAGIRVKFKNPIDIEYEGFAAQKVQKFSFRVSQLRYAKDYKINNN